MADSHARVSVNINRSREDVFAYLIDPETQRAWQSGVLELEAELAGRPQGRGLRAGGSSK